MKCTGQYQKRWIHDGPHTEHECLKFRYEFESQGECLGTRMGEEKVKHGTRQINDLDNGILHLSSFGMKGDSGCQVVQLQISSHSVQRLWRLLI